MCEDSQGRPANMLLFQIQMGVLTNNFKIIIKITRPPVQSSPVQSTSPANVYYPCILSIWGAVQKCEGQNVWQLVQYSTLLVTFALVQDGTCTCTCI